MNLKTLLENVGPKDCKKCLLAPLCKDKKKCPYKKKEE